MLTKDNSPRRYIGQNIRLINDIMEQTKLQNIPGILLYLTSGKHLTPLNSPLSRILYVYVALYVVFACNNVGMRAAKTLFVCLQKNK